MCAMLNHVLTSWRWLTIDSSWSIITFLGTQSIGGHVHFQTTQLTPRGIDRRCKLAVEGYKISTEACSLWHVIQYFLPRRCSCAALLVKFGFCESQTCWDASESSSSLVFAASLSRRALQTSCMVQRSRFKSSISSIRCSKTPWTKLVAKTTASWVQWPNRRKWHGHVNFDISLSLILGKGITGVSQHFILASLEWHIKLQTLSAHICTFENQTFKDRIEVAIAYHIWAIW